MYAPAPDGTNTPRRRRPLRFYVIGALRTPQWTISDIAIDRPWIPGGLLLTGVFALAGLALGATGLPSLGQGLRGALLGAATVPLIGLASFVVMSVPLHLAARSLEGIGGYLELVSALVFAFLPFVLLAPASLLRLLPGAWGGFVFFLALLGIGGWVVRLTYLAVRESHRFTGTQAILSMLIPILLAVLFTMAAFFVTALGVLVTA